MINFILMLTHGDATVPDAVEHVERLTGTGLRYLGFKDVGATPQRQKEINAAAHAAGFETMLEVVSVSREAEIASVTAAVAAGVDWVLGGTHPDAALPLLRGTGIRYCPFPGRVVGHPSVLEGSVAEIAASAAQLTALDGVGGVDLLAYRHADADIAALTAAVVAASAGPVIAAGSVVAESQIRTLAAAGAWGFTIGSAIFDGAFPGAPDVAAQVAAVLAVADAV
ncbi:hypothetical protein [Pseudonocardia sp. GCM10023141]|uniref:hypothetical protein n=1 Tax=Pseudonocardia sp. GCM10023141 TaxID=3252653 RepID=UPI00361C6889